MTNCQRGTQPTVCFLFGNPHSSLPTPIAQSSPAGITSDRVPAPPPVEMGGQCQNGARRQGFAAPRQTPARPCLLRSVPASIESRRAAPAGTRSEPSSVLTDHLENQQTKARRLPAARETHSAQRMEGSADDSGRAHEKEKPLHMTEAGAKSSDVQSLDPEESCVLHLIETYTSPPRQATGFAVWPSASAA